MDVRIVVTGGSGFLGGHLVRRLQSANPADEVVALGSSSDLRDPASARKAFEGADGIYHLAAQVGGITYNKAHPADLLHVNALMGMNVLEAARATDAGWVVVVSSACAYPGDAPVPTTEEALWAGYPEPTNAPYGIAKRLVMEGAAAYARQHGLRARVVVPTNLYGPGDTFDPERSHVIPALIARFHAAKEARQPAVVCWGDGSPTRDFLYVEDCADLLAEAPRCLTDAAPVNLATGEEVSIRELVGAIRDVTGYEGDITWDTSKPNGQQRRALSVERMEARFGRRRFVPLREGLRRTYASYQKHPLEPGRGRRA